MGMWEEISSSSISRAKYDVETKTLEIQFTGGAIYSYTDVDEDEYASLVNAASPGSYFHENIKGNYNDRRVG